MKEELGLLSLLDKLISLAAGGRQLHAGLYKDLIEPTLVDFQALHDDYLAALRGYAQLATDEAIAFDHQHPLFRAVESDLLFSDAVRAKFTSAWRLDKTDARLYPLIESLLSYLEGVFETTNAAARNRLAERYSKWPTPIRLPATHLKEELRLAVERSLGPTELRAVVLECISRVAQCRQNAHLEVVQSFNTLKTELSKPS